MPSAIPRSGILLSPLFAVLVFAWCFSVPALAAAPQCQTSTSDPDGDGWGWENNQSCTVSSGPSTQQTNGCDYSQAASQNGWGWNAQTGSSCAPLTTPSSQDSCDYSNAEINNGWGWNANTSTPCAPLESVGSRENNCDYSNAASQGGWGWNAVERMSCPPVEVTANKPTVLICDAGDNPPANGWRLNPLADALTSYDEKYCAVRCSDTNVIDDDGDGWAWVNADRRSCFVTTAVAGQRAQVPLNDALARQPVESMVESLFDDTYLRNLTDNKIMTCYQQLPNSTNRSWLRTDAEFVARISKDTNGNPVITQYFNQGGRTQTDSERPTRALLFDNNGSLILAPDYILPYAFVDYVFEGNPHVLSYASPTERVSCNIDDESAFHALPGDLNPIDNNPLDLEKISWNMFGNTNLYCENIALWDGDVESTWQVNLNTDGSYSSVFYNYAASATFGGVPITEDGLWYLEAGQLKFDCPAAGCTGTLPDRISRDRSIPVAVPDVQQPYGEPVNQSQVNYYTRARVGTIAPYRQACRIGNGATISSQ